MTTFDYYKNLINKKEEIDIENVSIFFLVYLLSHDELSIFAIDKILKYIYYLNENVIYQYLFYKIPKHRPKYIKTEKKTKDKYLKYAKILYPEMSEIKLEENMVFLKDKIEELLNG